MEWEQNFIRIKNKQVIFPKWMVKVMRAISTKENILLGMGSPWKLMEKEFKLCPQNWKNLDRCLVSSVGYFWNVTVPSPHRVHSGVPHSHIWNSLSQEWTRLIFYCQGIAVWYKSRRLVLLSRFLNLLYLYLFFLHLTNGVFQVAHYWCKHSVSFPDSASAVLL